MAFIFGEDVPGDSIYIFIHSCVHSFIHSHVRSTFTEHPLWARHYEVGNKAIKGSGPQEADITVEGPDAGKY